MILCGNCTVIFCLADARRKIRRSLILSRWRLALWCMAPVWAAPAVKRRSGIRWEEEIFWPGRDKAES